MKKVFMILICGVVVFACVCAVGVSSTSSTTQQQGQPNIERTVMVDYVVDGDTISLQGGEKVRLVGVNTPEIHPPEPGGIEAKEFVENLCPPGTEIGLDVDDLDPTDHYGRIIAVVYLNVDESWVNLNAELLQRGHAEVLFIPPSEFNPYEWTS